MSRSLRRKDSTAPATLLHPRIKRLIEKLANCHQWPVRQAMIRDRPPPTPPNCHRPPTPATTPSIYLADLALASNPHPPTLSFAQYDEILEPL